MRMGILILLVSVLAGCSDPDGPNDRFDCTRLKGAILVPGGPYAGADTVWAEFTLFPDDPWLCTWEAQVPSGLIDYERGVVVQAELNGGFVRLGVDPEHENTTFEPGEDIPLVESRSPVFLGLAQPGDLTFRLDARERVLEYHRPDQTRRPERGGSP
jgi:hypothetical protein